MDAVNELKNIIAAMSFLPFEMREGFQNEIGFLAKTDRGIHYLVSLLDYLHEGVADPAVKNYLSRVKLKLITGFTISQVLGEVVEEA